MPFSTISAAGQRDTEPVIVLLFGPPGCGKGIQAAFIASRFGLPTISTGEMFRCECKAGTELGELACSILSCGGLVNDELVNKMLVRRISSPEFSSGFVLDGYPRTLPQGQFLDRTLAERGSKRVISIHLDVPFPVIVERIASRRSCPHCLHIYNLLFQPPKTAGVCDSDGTLLITREDDREEVIWRRLKVYEEQTGPVLRHYAESTFHRIDGTLRPAEVSSRIEAVLQDCAVLV
jgi:adenylate kinase